MYDEDDPLLRTVSDLALAFPGAAMKISHGRPAFFTRKIFVYYGGSVRHGPDDWEQHNQAIMVLPADDAERAALLQLAVGFEPAYLGPYGWVGVDLDDSTDWVEIAELVDTSYRRTATKRLIRELDQQ